MLKKYWWVLLVIGAVILWKMVATPKLSCSQLRQYVKANPCWTPGLCA